MSEETKMDATPVEQTDTTRGVPKSGRWWKDQHNERHTSIIQSKPLKTSFKKKMDLKNKQKQVKLLQEEIRNKIAQEKQDKILRAKEQEARKLENQKKAEIVQVVKNMEKLKKIKKKHLRTIATRDV